MPEAVVGIDAGQRIVYFNRSAERLFGYAPADILGQKLDILIPRTYRARHHDHVARFKESGRQALVMHERTEIAAQRSNGTTFQAEATIVRGRSPERPVFYAILRDITEQKLREAALKASERKYRAILEGSPEPILIANAMTGRLADVNAAAARLFGCSRKDLIGLHQTALHPEEMQERFARTFREHIEEGRVLVPDGLARKASGEVVPVEISASPVEIDGAQHLVGFFRDVTHRVEQETALRQALAAAKSAAAAKRAFLANMSHELRTPLNGIIGFSDLIAHEIHGPHVHPAYKEYGTVIRESGHHLLEIVNDVLDLSRIDADQYRLDDEIFAPADVVAEVRAMLAPLIEDSAVELRAAVDPALRLRADRRAVKQMLINLMSNAIKFTPATGQIQIAASLGDSGELVIGVSDTGVGIPPERLQIVSEPFANDKDVYVKSKGGTGIGLSITRKLIELHDGRFAIESVVGAGTRVDLIFPAARSQPPLPEAQPIAAVTGTA